MNQFFSTEENFLGITESELFEYESSKVVIQSAPYEFTSSYLQGSDKGPEEIINASHFVEFYDEETDQEAYKKVGICTLKPLDFTNKVNIDAVNLIEESTNFHLEQGKFVVSLGSEHTVSLGFVKAFAKHHSDFSVLQIDAHSDLRSSYHDNPYSHASVLARIHDLGLPICQVGIRAQCKEEAELIKSSSHINTFYAHQLYNNNQWMDDCISKLKDKVYITIDADGFDPSVMPAVGTAEPGGLTWHQGLEFLRKVSEKKQIIGFDVVECAPKEGEILTQFNLAKLVYKIIGYCCLNNQLSQ
jgi:agmatinase